MRDELKNGKTPEQAAADAGVKLEKLPTFALVENQPGQKPTPKPKNAPPEAPDMPYIKQAVSQMNPGEVSGFTRTPTGGLLVVMEKRAPIDPRQYEAARPIIENQAVENKSQIVFFEWLRERRRAAGVEENKPQTAPS